MQETVGVTIRKPQGNDGKTVSTTIRTSLRKPEGNQKESIGKGNHRHNDQEIIRKPLA